MERMEQTMRYLLLTLLVSGCTTRFVCTETGPYKDIQYNHKWANEDQNHVMHYFVDDEAQGKCATHDLNGREITKEEWER